jgi:hypothetical protein
MEVKHTSFPGTFFSSEIVLKIVSVAKIASWVFLGVYGAQFLVQLTQMLLQIARGFWAGMGYTDIAYSLLLVVEATFRGVVYFIVLQAAAQVLLMLMDVEDNTRRSARKSGK